MHNLQRHPVFVLLALWALLGACAPQPSSTTSVPGAPGRPEVAQAPRGPKILTIGSQRAPYDLNRDLGERETGVGGASTIFMLPHDLLVVEDDQGAWVPRLAAEQLSVEK